MLLKNLIALLAAASLAVVSATNSTNSSSSAAASTSSSSSSGTAAAGGGGGNSSSSGTAAATGSSSSSTAAATGSSSSSTAAATGAGSSSSGTAAATGASSSAGTTTTSSSNSSSSSSGGSTSGTTYTHTADSIKSAVEFTIGGFASYNGTDAALGAALLADTGFVTAFAESIVLAAGLTAAESSKCTVISIAVSAGRRLSEQRQLAAGDKKLNIDFTLEVAPGGTAATALVAATGASPSGTTLVSQLIAKVNGNTYAGVATTVATQTIAAVTAAAPTVVNSGTWNMKYYSDSACSTVLASTTTYEAKTGSISTAVPSNCAVLKHSGSHTLKVAACVDGDKILGEFTSGGTACGTTDLVAGTTNSLTFAVPGKCTQITAGAIYSKFTCTGGSGTTATSSAVSKSIVGVVMGLFMGLVALV